MFAVRVLFHIDSQLNCTYILDTFCIQFLYRKAVALATRTKSGYVLAIAMCAICIFKRNLL